MMTNAETDNKNSPKLNKKLKKKMKWTFGVESFISSPADFAH
jgi:hypothetical protein